MGKGGRGKTGEGKRGEEGGGGGNPHHHPLRSQLPPLLHYTNIVSTISSSIDALIERL
jgi:hypothetical protein